MKEDSTHIEPSINWKCLVFTIVIAGGYWFLPQKNKWILAILLYIPYIILAWYDYWYKCEKEYGPTYLAPLYWWAKPENSKYNKLFSKWSSETKTKAIIINIAILVTIICFIPSFLKWNPDS